MPKRKRTKEYVMLSRNSYKGRFKGILPAFLPNRCRDLTDGERFLIEGIEQAIQNLLIIMDRRS